MLEKRDIEEAKKVFIKWDNKNIWKIPSEEFIEHCKRKAKDSLNLSIYLLDKIEKTNELNDNESVFIWIITQSYYSMFFEVEYLLSLDNKKLPDNVKDTHKKTYLAFLFYYIIKGSELEQKNNNKITTSRMSKALAMFQDLQDETLELQRVKKCARDLKKQKDNRNFFTYRMTRLAEMHEAKKAVDKAIEFRQLIEEYVLSKY